MTDEKPGGKGESRVYEEGSRAPDGPGRPLTAPETAVATVAAVLPPDGLEGLSDEELEAVAAGKRVGRIGGRQKGTSNHVGRAARRLCRKLVSDPEYLRSVERRLLAGQASNLENLLWHYAYGKPAQQVNVDGQMQVAQVTVVKQW